jgi:small subunit ribosomal protein S8e
VITRKSRCIDVVYNASNNELVRTKSLVKGAIILIDSTPFRTWYEQHYGVKMSAKKGSAAAAKQEEETAEEKKSNSVQRKHASRAKARVIDPALADQMAAGKVYACISSRPGQSGRCDGYVLEGKELEFYVRKLKAKKGGAK